MTNMFENNTQPNELETEIAAIKEKYKDNPDEMIKALVHSQKHIKTIETENAEYKTKVAQATTLDSVMAKLKESNVTPQPVGTQTVTTPSVLDDNTLQQKIEEALNKKTEAERQAASQALVQKTLLDHFKTVEKAKAEMAAKADELGMTAQELDAIALRSPKAFFQFFGIDGKTTSVNTAPSQGTVRTNLINVPANQKNEAY